MGKFFKKQKNVILFLAALLLIPTILFTLQTSKQKISNSGNYQSANQPSSNASSPTPSAITIPYTVSYPQGWDVATLPFPGGFSLMMTGKGWPGDPIMVIETYDSASDLASKERFFQDDGFTKTTYTLADGQAVKYSGTWNTRSINYKMIKIKNQERIVFLQKPHALYALKMYYSGSSSNETYEKLFEQILTTFKLK